MRLGGEPGHVLHQTEHGHADLRVAEHLDALAGVGQGHLLRCRDYNGAGHGQGLHQRQVYIAGARRHIDEEVVELAPVSLGDELLEGVGGHAATPEHGAVGIHHQTDAQQLDAVAFHGHYLVDAVNLVDIDGLTLYAEHLGHGGTKDVGI